MKNCETAFARLGRSKFGSRFSENDRDCPRERQGIPHFLRRTTGTVPADFPDTYFDFPISL